MTTASDAQPAIGSRTVRTRTRTWHRVDPPARPRGSTVTGVTASPPPRTPVRTGLPRVALRYCLVLTAGLILLLVLVAGCGATPLPPAAPSTIAPTTAVPLPPPSPTTTAPPTSSTRTTVASPESGSRANERPAPPAPDGVAPRPGGTGSTTPIWPARDAASAARLQGDVDGGRQPWLLDPVEVAVSYAGSELGYRNPGVFPIAAGRVDVQDGRTPAKATITLAQTVRRGEGGIWLVTGVQRR